MRTEQQRELRELIRSKLTDGMTPDEAADAVASLFYRVEDDWGSIDVTSVGQLPGSQVLEQRSLVAWVPRESRSRNLTPDRTVTP